jgi:hypothetical protein
MVLEPARKPHTEQVTFTPEPLLSYTISSTTTTRVIAVLGSATMNLSKVLRCDTNNPTAIFRGYSGLRTIRNNFAVRNWPKLGLHRQSLG